MTGGRPLRFLALALGGWVAVRVVVLLPEIGALPASAVIPHLIKALIPEISATGLKRTRAVPAVGQAQVVMPLPIGRGEVPRVSAHAIRAAPSNAVVILASHVAVAGHVDQIPSPIAPPAPLRGPSRLNGSAWLLVRGGPAGTVSGGQLGASQGGIRLTYALGSRRRFALAARLAAPLKGKGREAALGLEWQPTRLPIRLVAEQRVVLDGGRGGPTLGVIAGYGPSDIAPGLRLEAYGQAGGIARDGLEGFVDASARITHPLGRIGRARIDIGAGAWGSAQRAAARFDIGPSIVATLPVQHKTIRLTLDWRERVAGDARPGSGPALSIGSDF
ncbi:hypothetical protein VH567_06215 [Sphingomonas sp. 4RDLI-65]|uniref:hypothetical protein n=1 Tax=Sphingomonas sp. 4RDLI-65 TaxID=3111641 RepID=UPI003C145358